MRKELEAPTCNNLPSAHLQVAPVGMFQVDAATKLCDKICELEVVSKCHSF